MCCNVCPLTVLSVCVRHLRQMTANRSETCLVTREALSASDRRLGFVVFDYPESLNATNGDADIKFARGYRSAVDVAQYKRSPDGQNVSLKRLKLERRLKRQQLCNGRVPFERRMRTRTKVVSRLILCCRTTIDFVEYVF